MCKTISQIVGFIDFFNKQYKMSILSIIIILLNLNTVSCAFSYSGQSALKNGGTNIPDKNTAMNKVYITNIYIHSDATMIT